jgi:hypothetical protein
MHTYGVHLIGSHDALTALTTHKDYQFLICDIFPNKDNLIPYPGKFHIQTQMCQLNAGIKQLFNMCPPFHTKQPASTHTLNGAST